MSIINQMLRDLDARGRASNDSPQTPIPAPRAAGRPAWGKAVALLGVLSVGGIAGYGALSTPTRPSAALPVDIAGAQRASGTDGEAVPPPLAAAGPGVQRLPPPAMPAALPAPAVEAGTMMPLAGFKLTRSLSTPDPATRPQAAAPVGMEPQPAVVKKMAEIPPETEAQQFYDEAQALRRLGRVDAAAGKYRLALDRHPGLRNARIQLASLMQETGQGDAALALLKTGYAYQPDSAMAIATGRLLADQGQRAEALDWLQRGQDSLRPSDLALMGALLSKAARYEEAVNAYQQALRAEPHQGGWLLGQGLALESLGLRQEAQTAFRNALEHGAFKPEVVTFLRLKINAAGP